VRLLFVTFAALFGAALISNVVAALTLRIRRQLEGLERLQSAHPPRIERERTNPRSRADAANLLQPPSPDAESLGTHIRRVLSPEGLRGLCFVPVLVMFLVANTRLMAEAFELTLDHPGTPLGQLTLFGLSLAITDLHIYGLALSAALLLAGGAYAAQCEKASSVRWFTLLAILVPLVAFETGTSYLRGLTLAAENPDSSVSAWALALQNGLQGFFCATVEAISGYYVIESFLIPCLQLLSWTAMAPLRAIKRRLEERRAARARNAHDSGPRLVQLVPTLGAFGRLAAYLDEAWFEPLRRLDRATAARFRRAFHLSTEASHD
jgi:hypothetical protein